MLVDCINHRLPGGATPTTVTGPFHIHDSPNLDDGADIAQRGPGERCFIVGSVRDLQGRPITGATLDICIRQADGDGLYEGTARLCRAMDARRLQIPARWFVHRADCAARSTFDSRWMAALAS